MSRAGGLALLGLIVAAAPSQAQTLERRADGVLALGSLPPIFDEERVWREATSGLTAVLVVSCAAERGSRGVIGRIELRYELWDEELRVAVTHGTGVESTRALPDRAAVAEWWRAFSLEFGAGCEPTGRASRSLEIVVELFPFSREEQDAARRWLAEAPTREERGATEGARGGIEGGSDTLGRVFGLLMATSIEAHAVATWRWSLPLPGVPAVPAGRQGR